MPAAEAVGVASDEFTSYELAFHVLPTVAEGEVPTVTAAITAAIIAHGGSITDEEAAARVELAYEVVKPMEGRNRKFKSAYFGWVRFKADAAEIPGILEVVENHGQILRHLLVKLTREEEQHPFRFHEAMAAANIMVAAFDLTDEEVVEGDVEEVVEEDAVATDTAATPDAVDTKTEVA